MKNLLLFVSLLFIISCGNNKKASQKEEKTIERTIEFIELLKKSQKEKIDFSLLQIKNLENQFENTTDKDSLASEKWTINLSKFKKIIALSTPISEAEKHYAYDIKLKSINGIAIYEKDTLSFTINGGGWLYISDVNNENNYILLGCNLPECEKYFITRGFTPDDN